MSALPPDRRPLVSIVVLNWNGLGRLKRCLPSLLAIEYPNLEFVVVDNGSTDGSLEYLRETSDGTGHSFHLEALAENLGYSKGKNHGASLCRGKYIWLLDNDIEADPGAVTRLVDHMEAHEAVWASMPLLYDGTERDRVFNSGGKFTPYGISFRGNANLRSRTLDPATEAVPISYPAGGVLFVRRDWWERSGAFDPMARLYLDDYDFGARTWVAGGEVHLVLTARTYHHEDAPNDYMERGDWKWREEFRGGAMFLIKNFQMRNVLVMLPLLLARHGVQILKVAWFRRRPLFVFTVWLPSLASLLAPETRRHLANERRRVQALRTRPDRDFLFKV
ncbi:MAG: glycosyltransferase family 2 protein [Sumerlaeia bacterium]